MMKRKNFIVLIILILITAPLLHIVQKKGALQKSAALSQASWASDLKTSFSKAFSRSPVVEPYHINPAVAGKSCAGTLEDLSGPFNIEKFKNILRDIEHRGEVTDDDVQTAIGDPEKLLAIIEYTSRQRAYEGFGFSKLLENMEKGDLKRLYEITIALAKPETDLRTSVTNVPEKKLTLMEQEDLLAEIYKIIHKPKGLFRTALKTRNLKKAFEQVKLETIRKRLDLSLYYDGMPKTFATITADPTLAETFRKTLNANRQWIDPLVFLGLWIPFAVYYPQVASPYVGPKTATLSEVLRWAPPTIPTFSKFFETIVTDQDRENALEKGRAFAIQRLNERVGCRIKFGQALRTSSVVYTSVFATLLVATVGTSIKAEIDHEAMEEQVENQNNVQKQFNSTLSMIGDLADMEKMTPKQKAELQIKRMVELMNQAGEKEDPNTQEMKELRDQFEAIFTQQEKQEKAASQKKKPKP